MNFMYVNEFKYSLLKSKLSVYYLILFLTRFFNNFFMVIICYNNEICVDNMLAISSVFLNWLNCIKLVTSEILLYQYFNCGE